MEKKIWLVSLFFWEDPIPHFSEGKFEPQSNVFREYSWWCDSIQIPYKFQEFGLELAVHKASALTPALYLPVPFSHT